MVNLKSLLAVSDKVMNHMEWSVIFSELVLNLYWTKTNGETWVRRQRGFLGLEFVISVAFEFTFVPENEFSGRYLFGWSKSKVFIWIL